MIVRKSQSFVIVIIVKEESKEFRIPNDYASTMFKGKKR